jgi:hypothetical protein
MKTKKLCQFATILFLLGAIPHSWALQAGAPAEALEEMATADNIETVIKHLPVKVEEYMEKLPVAQRTAMAEKLLVRRNLEREGGKLAKSDDGSTWELVEKEGRAKTTVTLKKTFVSGIDALLQLEIKEEHHTGLIMVGMRYEGNEWRLSEVGEWRGTDVESEFLPKEETPVVPGEAAAAALLRTLNTSLVSYAATYPDVGYPASLQVLSGMADQESAQDHARLLDESFMRSPLVKQGYEIRYAATDRQHYQIIAMPLALGEGQRSLFTDETCVLRATNENRPATAHDPPLE